MRNTFVTTKNVLNFKALCASLREPSARGCGLGVVFGDRGRGKTETSIWYTQSQIETTVRIRVDALWTARGFLEVLVRELRQEPAYKTTDLLEQIRGVLKKKRHLVVIDEADYLLKEATRIETVRDIYDTCLTPFLLVGMAGFERKIHRFPQVVDRVRDNFLEFGLLDREDTARLATELCEAKLAQDAVDYICANTDGSLRQIETFVRIAERAANARDLDEVCARHLIPQQSAAQVREAMARTQRRVVPRGAPVLREPAKQADAAAATA
jgi:DNA transposition AAA+ family ATPase